MTYRYFQILSFSFPRQQENLFLDALDFSACLGWEKDSKCDALWMNVRLYFEEDYDFETQVERFKKSLGDLKEFRHTVLGLPLERGAELDFSPYELVTGYWVASPVASPDEVFFDKTASRKILWLKSGQAFGTGRHETTRLVARLLAERQELPESMLDVGTGSGILAILGKALGVRRVEAVEIAAEARDCARENFCANAWEDFTLHHQISEVQGSFPMVLANLMTTTLIQIETDLRRCTSRGGELLLSGIPRNEVEELLAVYTNWKVERKVSEGDWLGLALLKT